MTDIEQKALALVNEVGEERMGMLAGHINREITTHEALFRAIERHEAFKQEVSDAVQSWVDGGIDRPAYLWFRKKLEQFIIPKPKPDPLVKAMKDLSWDEETAAEEWANDIRAALDALGFEIREKGQ